MNTTQKTINFILVFLVGFLISQCIVYRSNVKRLEKLTDELITVSSDAVNIAKEYQAKAENWKTLYQLSGK